MSAVDIEETRVKTIIRIGNFSKRVIEINFGFLFL